MTATKAEVQRFIDMIAPIAQRQAAKHGGQLYPSVCIAQAAQESGWGTTARMLHANALFGVKVGKSAYKFGTAWDGSAYKTGTTEYYDGKNATRIVDWFRAYSSVEAATEDYMDMLCHCQRYKKALNCKSPEESIRAIVAGGYATGPEYAEHVITIINTHHLKQYDPGGKVTPTTGNPYKEPTSSIRLHSQGEGVKWLQTELNRIGYGLKVDGIAGMVTILALMAFQKDHSGAPYNLVVDGICGPKTRAVIKSI